MPRAAWRATISKPLTPRAATDFKRYGFKQEYGFQERLLRAKISLPPDHYIPPCPYGAAISASQDYCLRDYYAVKSHYVPACPAETVAPRAATASRHDTAFGRDYYALKSHGVPTITSRLALPNPHSWRLRDYYAVKSHYVPTCAAEPATPRAATASKQDTAFKRDYYAVKSHCIPIIVPRLDLSDPQSRHLKIIAFEIITQ